MLSTITSDTSTPNKIISGNKLLVFRVSYGLYNPKFNQIASSEIAEDKNKIKVLCFFDRTNNVYGKQDKELYLNDTKCHNGKLGAIFSSFEDVSFYAIAKDTDEARVKKEFNGFITLDEFVKDKIINSKLDFIGIKAASTSNYYYNYDAGKAKFLLELISENSPYYKMLIAYKTISDLKEKKYSVSLYETLTKEITAQEIRNWWANNSHLNFTVLQTKCHKLYPLINDHTYYNVDITHIAQYINFIDSLI
jgi:hypothetical protein